MKRRRAAPAPWRALTERNALAVAKPPRNTNTSAASHSANACSVTRDSTLAPM
ncbi:Uncharacterised protein [Burkholderia pseudomallei]|nr:Uncharacterised protein [Burkholderia pseudomallei]